MTALDKFINSLEPKIVKDATGEFDFKEFSQLSNYQKVNTYCQYYQISKYYRQDKTGIYCCKCKKTIVRIGKNYFPRSSKTAEIYIKNNKCKVSGDISDDTLEFFFDQIRPLWENIKNIGNSSFLAKPSIIKDILLDKVYNQETFYRAIAKHCYKIKNVEWRMFKTFLTSRPYHTISIFDIKDYTVNFDNSLRIFNNLINNREYNKLNLITDMLHYAVLLDQKINLNWSDKRMDEEHQKQIRLANLKDIEEKDDKPIFDETIATQTIKMLNSEKEMFLEGLNMHHCIYSYYSRVKNGNYLAFHMSSPEDCTFGLKLTGNRLVIDQIYLKYDKHVAPVTKDVAQQFLDSYRDELMTYFKKDNEQIIENNWRNFFGEDELPDLLAF